MTAKLFLLPSLAAFISAGQVQTQSDPKTGWEIVTLSSGDIVATVVPAAGCNVFSIKYKGREILRQPPSLADLTVPGYMYGVPVLYPTPNRVAASKFTFGGREFAFEPNNGPNFLHGLIHSAAFLRDSAQVVNKTASALFRLELKPGQPFFDRFPLPHDLILSIQVEPDSVRWTYTVDNSAGKAPIPYGFAIHPWFLYQGSRAKTRLTVPATHWMEAIELLPTGKLVPIERSKFDARTGRSLEGFVIDDVFFGMKPEQPTRIDFEDAKLSIALSASKEFTHLVVYTPLEPHFCVENQTCSTDAHNLYAKGLKNESHLQVVPPGGEQSGWVQMSFHSD